MRGTRIIGGIAIGLACAAPPAAFAQTQTTPPTAAPAPAPAPSPGVQRGMPGKAHALFERLVGKWNVEMTFHPLEGPPVVSRDLTTVREMVGDGRFLKDVTWGSFGGNPYWRQGMLGFSNVDGRFQWVTQDQLNTEMMIYQSEANAKPAFPITLSGTFTEQGVLNEALVGQPIGQRTVITVEGRDRHVIDIYFTLPGQAERLFDHKVYTRQPPDPPDRPNPRAELPDPPPAPAPPAG